MSDLLDEVLNDQKYELYSRYVKKALPVVFILSLIVSVCIFIYDNKIEEQKKLNQINGDILFSVLTSDGTLDQKINILDELVNKNIEISNLAVLYEINLLSNQDPEAAKVLIKKVLDSRNDNFVKNYAKSILISISLDENIEYNCSDYHFITQVTSSFLNEKEPFWHMAQILQSLWLIKYNLNDNAKKILESLLVSKTINMQIKQQAQIILKNLN